MANHSFGIVNSVAFSAITFYGSVLDDEIYFDRMQAAVVDISLMPEPHHYAMLLTGLSLLSILAAYHKRQRVSVD